MAFIGKEGLKTTNVEVKDHRWLVYYQAQGVDSRDL